MRDRTLLRSGGRILYGEATARLYEPLHTASMPLLSGRRRGRAHAHDRKAATTMLEDELTDVLRSARLDAKQRRAVARRLGWDGRGPTTLSRAGATEGYTRERVRQLEQRVIRHVERTRPRLELTQAALDAVHAAAPAWRGQLARMLSRTQIAAEPFDPLGVVRAAELCGIPVSLIEHGGLILQNEQACLADDALRLARTLVVRDGATSVGALAERLAVRAGRVRELLEFRDDVTWLDEQHDWLAVPAARTRAATALRKMLSLAPRLTLTDIRGGLDRQRLDVQLPWDVLRSLCDSYDWLTFDRGADVVSLVTPLDPERTLSGLERQLVGIFQAEGPVLSFTRAVRLAEAAGMNPASAGVYLSRSPVFETVSRGRHAIRGYGGEVLSLRAAVRNDLAREALVA
ncbi:MAG: hypothetical protein M3O89_05215 [Actinomycetota bacterium]|nr:hypothetical protein [Actinomycetota bacterium]